MAKHARSTSADHNVADEIEKLTGVDPRKELDPSVVQAGLTKANGAARKLQRTLAERRRQERAWRLLAGVDMARHVAELGRGTPECAVYLGHGNPYGFGRSAADRLVFIGEAMLLCDFPSGKWLTGGLKKLAKEARGLCGHEGRAVRKPATDTRCGEGLVRKRVALARRYSDRPEVLGTLEAQARSANRKMRRMRIQAAYPESPSTKRDRARLFYGFHVVDALRRLPKASVQCVVTSIPYWGHRTYGTREVAWKDGWVGHLGMESTMEDYVAHVVEVFDEVRRVLKDDGVVWIDIGDKHVGGGGGSRVFTRGRRADDTVDEPDQEIAPGHLLFLPARVGMGLQEAGWVVRSKVTWGLLNPSPETRESRPGRTDKTLLMLTKKAGGYFYDRDGFVEPTLSGSTKPLGSVWEIGWGDERYPEKRKHRAVFPVELATRCILLTSRPDDHVLDPFNGSGTTSLAALRHGRVAVGIDLQQNYLDECLARIDGLHKHPQINTPALNFSKNNRKSKTTSKVLKSAIGKDGRIWSFNLPAWRSVLGRLICLNAAGCIKDCFARNLFFKGKEMAENNLYALDLAEREHGEERETAYTTLLDEMMEEVQETNRARRRKKVRAIRLHDSGDFFEAEYLRAWLAVMRKHPELIFYCYTKEVSMVLAEDIPENFIVVFSEGGKEDRLIPLEAARSRIFAPEDYDQAVASGEWVGADKETGDIAVLMREKRIALKRHNRSNVPFTDAQRRSLRARNARNDDYMANWPLAAK